MGRCINGCSRPDIAKDILSPFAKFEAVPVCSEPTALDPGKIHTLLVQQMWGYPVRMPFDCAPLRRWLRATEIGDDLTDDEAGALIEFFEGLNGIECLMFENSCGTSICDIVRLMHLIECRAFTACVALPPCALRGLPRMGQ